VIPAFLILFYGFWLVGSFSLGKFVAVGVCGLWLSLGAVKWKDSVGPLAYLAAVSIAAVFSVDPWLSFWGLQGTYSTGLLCALSLIPFWTCLDSSDRESWESGIRWGAVVCSAIGLLQLRGVWVPSPLPGGSRVYSTMGSPVYLGALLVLAFPLLGSNLERLIVLACLVATKSRGAWLALVLAQVYRNWDRISLRVKVWGGAAVVAGAFGSFLLRPASDIGRLLVWTAAIQAFKAKPLFGWGTGNFIAISELFHTPAWDRVYGTVANTQDQAHNIFLEAASTGGVLTLIAICYMLRNLWGKADKKIRVGLLGVFVVGLLNPLPLVVKALSIGLVAVGVKGEENRFASIPVRAIQVSFLCCLSILVYWDLMIGVHGDYPWSLSSLKSAMAVNAIRTVPAASR
jgi:hypothetical protein